MHTNVIGFAYGLLDPLLGKKSARNMAELDQALPWVGTGVFEARLGPMARQSLDLSLGILPTDGHLLHFLPEYLAQKLEQQGISDWDIQPFLNHFVPQTTPLDTRLRTLWVEFDAANDPQQVVLDGFYFEPQQLAGIEADAVATLELLRGAVLPPEQKVALDTCLQAMPQQAMLNYLGLMVARNMHLKCCILCFSLDDMAAYLQVLGILPTSWAQVKSALAHWANYWVLNLEIGDRLLPRFGIECYASEDHPDPKRFWEQAFMEMNVKGLATWAEGLACLAWHEAAPPTARAMGNLTQINHLKLVVEPDGRLWTKIYLGFSCHQAEIQMTSY